jgi:hypothetical protein
MALIVIIFIMLIGMGIVGSLLSSITPFITKLGTISQYNIAYYGAVMWAERGLSVLRYHGAWFEGTSSISAGTTADNVRSSAPSFGMLKNDAQSDAGRTIDSRWTSIPTLWKGNIDSVYAATSSKDFNALHFGETINFPLGFDDTKNVDTYYTIPAPADVRNLFATTPTPSSISHLEGVLRVPEKIRTELGSSNNNLATNTSDPLADVDNDTVADDVIVSWWIEWYEISTQQPFKILPTIKQNFGYNAGSSSICYGNTSGDPQPCYGADNGIRESIINSHYTQTLPNFHNINTSEALPNVRGFNLMRNPDIASTLLTGHNILPLNSSLATSTLPTLLEKETSDVQNMFLSLGVINRMQTTAGDFIPFLEYSLRLCDDEPCTTRLTLPDPFYTLQWFARVGDYRASIDIHKPVKESTSASTFVTVF